MDSSFADEALLLADGADVHNIKALVATYRNLKKPVEILDEIERELRSFVVRKRLERQTGRANLRSTQCSPSTDPASAAMRR